LTYELFSANKSLFEGLYAEDNWDWNSRYPVIRISFGGGKSNITDFEWEMADNPNLLKPEY